MYIVKQCTKCKEVKPLSEYSKKCNGKDSRCKTCRGAYNKQYYQQNRERLNERHKQYVKQYREQNKERISEQKKQYREQNKERIREQKKQYYQQNRERVNEYQKQYREQNKERVNEYQKQYREQNKERVNERQKQWQKQNNARIREMERLNSKKRRDTDPLYKMTRTIRSLMYNSIKKQGYSKRSKTYKILGCDFETFKKHIERQFTKGMNWNNHGEWHYDHIIPISSAQTEEEVIKLNHYTNFQPLWAEDNLRKSNKIKPTQIKLRI